MSGFYSLSVYKNIKNTSTYVFLFHKLRDTHYSIKKATANKWTKIISKRKQHNELINVNFLYFFSDLISLVLYVIRVIVTILFSTRYKLRKH